MNPGKSCKTRRGIIAEICFANNFANSVRFILLRPSKEILMKARKQTDLVVKLLATAQVLLSLLDLVLTHLV